MTKHKKDIHQDISAASKSPLDRAESLSLFEPLLLSSEFKGYEELQDLALDLATNSASFRSSLAPQMAEALSEIVRSMNCYYSNLIEGHSTHPIDIERALKNDYSRDAKKRNLQLEAKAHIEVQTWIDRGGLNGPATRVESILEIHRRFCAALPDELLYVENSETKEKIKLLPGRVRDRDVQVGQHIAISPAQVESFLRRFEQAYSGLGRSQMLLAAAAAHHRLVWVHPFLDGNGRVARLVTHATLLETLSTGALWSVARGFARSVDRYKQLLHNCDLPRRNDLDGRGALSTEALGEFTHFFLETCLDQVSFMQKLIKPNEIQTRIMNWAKDEIHLGRLSQKSDVVLKAILFRGELPRKDVPEVTGVGERQARRITSELLNTGAIQSKGVKSPLLLAFPAQLAARWLPGLFPEQ